VVRRGYINRNGAGGSGALPLERRLGTILRVADNTPEARADASPNAVSEAFGATGQFHE
jgi:hypothetical protein